MYKIPKYIFSLHQLTLLYKHILKHDITIDLYLVNIFYGKKNTTYINHILMNKFSELRSYAMYENKKAAGINIPTRCFSYYEANLYTDINPKITYGHTLFTDQSIAKEYISVMEFMKTLGYTEEKLHQKRNEFLAEIQ